MKALSRESLIKNHHFLGYLPPVGIENNLFEELSAVTRFRTSLLG